MLPGWPADERSDRRIPSETGDRHTVVRDENVAGREHSVDDLRKRVRQFPGAIGPAIVTTPISFTIP